MTRDELNEKYGDAKVTFFHYHKFTFTFKGTLPDGKTITARMGGPAHDIYREDVTAGKEKTIRDLYPYSVSVMDGDKEIESFLEL